MGNLGITKQDNPRKRMIITKVIIINDLM